MYLAEFMNSPMAASLMWYSDAGAGEFVGECNRCHAELRFAKDTASVELTFKHDAECSWMLELEQNSRVWELIRKLASVLGDERDPELALSALVVIVGIACDVVAVQDGSSMSEVADRFAGELRSQLVKISGIISEVQKRAEAA